jgi:hypothetical protein
MLASLVNVPQDLRGTSVKQVSSKGKIFMLSDSKKDLT